MISIEKLRAVKTIVAHADCPDGIASAILARDALSDAKVVFAKYGTPETEGMLAEEGMLFVDFSPPAARVGAFLEAGALVLDHHRTAQGVVLGFVTVGQGVFGDEAKDLGVSGAMLVFENVWQPLARAEHDGAKHLVAYNARDFAVLAGIRDTWRRSDGRWREACVQAEWLKFYGESLLDYAHDFDFFTNADNEDQYRFEVGTRLLQNHEREVARAVKEAWHATFVREPKTQRAGSIAIIADSRLTSDAAEALDKQVDVLAGFRYFVDSGGVLRMNVSLRSHTDIDVGAIAKRYGGGGHTRAAGYTVEVDAMPYAQILDEVEMYFYG